MDEVDPLNPKASRPGFKITYYILFTMNDQITTLLNNLKANSIAFKDVIEFIETRYQHTPTAFKNGDTYNEAIQNQGSAKVFTFAQINNLSKEDTLTLFAEHYQAVLNTPDATDHQNIRQFMAHGWPGIAFEGQALVAK
jgi:hypothetical protein